jgi:hypothetical protein
LARVASSSFAQLGVLGAGDGGTVVRPTVNALLASNSVSKVTSATFLPVEVFIQFLLFI